MKYIFDLEEIDMIKSYLNGDLVFNSSFYKDSKKNFIRKAKKFVLDATKLYYIQDDLHKEVVANNDYEKQNEIFKELHLPDHSGIKAMYQANKTRYVGLKRENFNNFVSECIFYKRHEPLPRIVPIISEHPWSTVQMDCIDLRNY